MQVTNLIGHKPWSLSLKNPHVKFHKLTTTIAVHLELTVVLVIFATCVKKHKAKAEIKIRACLVFLWSDYCYWKPLCCLYRHAKLPTNWINRFLPYERVAKITKTTVP